MSKTYTFTDNTNSFTIRVDNPERSVEYTGGKNFCELHVSDVTENKYLAIRSNSAEFTEIIVNMDVDTILGIGAGSTTATELRDALLSSGIFFLDSSSTGSLEYQDYTIAETSWSGNTDYESIVTFTGAELGDSFEVSVSEDVETNLDNAGAVSYSNAYATGVDTVKVRGRISSYINIPTGAYLRVIKLV